MAYQGDHIGTVPERGRASDAGGFSEWPVRGSQAVLPELGERGVASKTSLEAGGEEGGDEERQEWTSGKVGQQETGNLVARCR